LWWRFKVTVIVEQQDVVAVIDGGSFQQYGRDTSFILDGSSSYDPDATGGSFYYTWSLPIGEYTFSLMVEKQGRNDTATVDVDIIAGAPPVIDISSLSKAKYNTDEDFVGLVSD
jgi:hypothetical protein